MAQLTYLNFDLTFESSAEGYAVRVTDSPAGQAGAPFVFPFNELELENFLLRLGQRSSGTRRADSPEMELSKQFGGRLFDALFDDDVRAALRSSISESERQGAGLRIRLRFGNTPELADIPWEYLYDGNANRFLTLSRETPLVRYLELSKPVEPLQVQAPLRILVMISDPSDYDRLDVEAEWQRLLTATATLRQRGLVEIVRLDKATLLELQRQLRDNQFHIFHYIGHGVFDESADDGFLVLEEENGRGRKVSGQYVGTMLADHRSLRLAVLNSCEGGRSSRSDPFAGAAQSLVQQGLPAVIAMQFEISDDAAAVFAQEFYMALAGGYPVDAALAEGRRAIFATKTNAEWGIPVLFMRAADGDIFGVQKTIKDFIRSEQRNSDIQERQFEAAMPEKAAVDRITEVRVQISLPGSPGLRRFLPDWTESGELIERKDVSTLPFQVGFPIDRETGKQFAVNLYIHLTTPGFECDEPTKALELSPDFDSGLVTFVLTPTQAQERARIRVELFRDASLKELLTSLTLVIEVRPKWDGVLAYTWRYVASQFRIMQRQPIAYTSPVSPGVSPPSKIESARPATPVARTILTRPVARTILTTPVGLPTLPREADFIEPSPRSDSGSDMTIRQIMPSATPRTIWIVILSALLILALIFYLIFRNSTVQSAPTALVPPTINFFRAEPAVIVRGKGESVQLSWSIAGDVSGVEISGPGIDSSLVLSRTGSLAIFPERSATLRLTARNYDQTVSQQATIEVVQPTPASASAPTASLTDAYNVTVTFNSVRIIDDCDGALTGLGEFWLDMTVNDQRLRWPQIGTNDVNSGQSYAIGYSTKVRLSGSDRLEITAAGFEVDETQIESMGSIRVSHTASDGWGAGNDSQSSLAVCSFVLGFTIEPAPVSFQKGGDDAPFAPSISEPLAPSFSTPDPASTSDLTSPEPATGAIRVIGDIAFVYVPAGEFIMGSNEEWHYETPVHTVYLDDFWIGRTLVTNVQYARCIEAEICPKPTNERWNEAAFADHPVTDLSWEDAVIYTHWLTDESGVSVRLPSEAEWEKACRGDDLRLYPWGDAQPTPELLNFYESRIGDTTAVGSYPAGASPYGALDMAGNVMEWVGDWFGDDYYGQSPERNPTGPGSGQNRVLRGGGYSYDSDRVRCASRYWSYPDVKDWSNGFRLFSPGS